MCRVVLATVWVALAVACSTERGGRVAGGDIDAPGDAAAAVDASTPAGPGGVVINELAYKTSVQPDDWVEIANLGPGVADLSGWELRDEHDDHVFAFADGTVLAAGAFLVLTQYDPSSQAAGADEPPPPGPGPLEYEYGLGHRDALRLFDPGGVRVDAVAWTERDIALGESYGRCRQAPAELGLMVAPTPGRANGFCHPPAPPIRFNEVVWADPEPHDWIELANDGPDAVSLAGWQIVDRDGPSFEFPAGAAFGPHYLLVLQRHDAAGEAVFTYDFGLAREDRVELVDPWGRIVDRLAWGSRCLDPGQSLGRPQDGPGHVLLAHPTRGAPNAAAAPPCDADCGPFDAVVTVGTSVFGLRADGTVACSPNAPPEQRPPPDETFLQIGAGNGVLCGVRTDRSLACYGYFGPDGPGEPPAGDFVSVAVGGGFACAIGTDGELSCWGPDLFGPTAQAGCSQVDIEGHEVCALLAPDGRLVCWLDPTIWAPQVVDGGGFRQIDLGWQGGGCGVRHDGTLDCWPPRYPGPPAGRYTAVSTSRSHACAVREGAGALVCWASDIIFELQPPAGAFSAVSVGRTNACALRGDGTPVCFGGCLGGSSRPLE